jgi:putative spermidine/putrescine transport system permease protein
MAQLRQAPPAPAAPGAALGARRAAVGQFSWNWLGVVPFFLFIIAFLILPSSRLITDSFQDSTGAFTLANFAALFRDPLIIKAYRNSLEIGVATSLIGGVFGFLVAYAITLGGAPGWVRSGLMTFSGIAANFGGVPLAFAFIATVGRTGFLTALLRGVGFDIYQNGFSLYSFFGLLLAYNYFQFPLMVLTISPALEGLRAEWQEASQNLGASSFQYWRDIAFPILLPSILGTMLLLFGSAFGAFATAQALTGGTLILASLLIGTEIRGDTLGNANLGYALAVGMVVIMAVTIGLYALLQWRASRWLR